MSRFVLFTITIGLSLNTYAGEVSLSDLKLANTYIKTTDVGLAISPSPTNAFSPTTVNCPHPGPCVLGIEVAAQFNGLNPPDPNVVGVILSVDSSTAEILPNAVLGLDSTSRGGASNARSFLWVRKNLSPGFHSVQVRFLVTAGSAASATRTLKIDVYRSIRPEDD